MEGFIENDNNLFEVNKVVNDSVSSEMTSELLNSEEIIKCIQSKENLSAPEADGLTSLFWRLRSLRSFNNDWVNEVMIIVDEIFRLLEVGQNDLVIKGLEQRTPKN